MTPDMIAALLESVTLARIATSSPATHQPHVVPVWFGWDGESIWISTFRSTRKVKDLESNPYCSIAIDTAESGVDFRAVIFEGRAELVTEPRSLVEEKTTWVYTRYLGPDGVLAPDPQSWIHDPQNLLIKLIPSRTYSWYSAAKEPSREE
jgi:general stress protein 26